MKASTLLIILWLTLILCGCASTNKIAALKPEPTNASPLTYETATSFIGMPVSIKLQDIENQTNQYLNGLIYEDKNIADDDIEMRIWKLAPIKIKNEKGRIQTVLPLKATIKYRIGTDRMGIDLYNVREFNLSGRVTLLSDVGMSNWKINTKTSLQSLKWNESPTTNVLGKAVPITYLINPTIGIFKSDIESTLDEAIVKAMDFKPNVLDALEKLSAPIEMSAEYQSWLRIVPIEIYATDASLKAETVSLTMGMKCNLETIIGQKPAARFERSKVILKPVAKMPDQITANIVAVSTYEDASKIMTNNFSGQEFGSGSKKVTVKNVEIWHKDGKMVVALDLLGSLDGRIYLAGFPQYNNQTKEIYFDQLDYALDTKNKLIRTANWLAQGIILDKIRENCRYSIKPNLEEGKQNMLKYLTNYSPMPGVVVNGTMNDIQFGKIQLTNRAIVAFVEVQGKVSVAVDGLK